MLSVRSTPYCSFAHDLWTRTTIIKCPGLGIRTLIQSSISCMQSAPTRCGIRQEDCHETRAGKGLSQFSTHLRSRFCRRGLCVFLPMDFSFGFFQRAFSQAVPGHRFQEAMRWTHKLMTEKNPEILRGEKNPSYIRYSFMFTTIRRHSLHHHHHHHHHHHVHPSPHSQPIHTYT